MTAPLILVAGALAAKPGNGGEAWVRATWVLGLRRLGCRVVFVEDLGTDDPRGREWFRRVTEGFGFADSAALVCGDEVTGMSIETLLARADEADLLVNLSGNLAHDTLLRRPRRRAFVDLDPGFTQMWDAEGRRGVRLSGHDLFFTVGCGIGRAGCSIPTVGIEWHPVRPPVLLNAWPARSRSSEHPYLRCTTVATWRNPFGPVVHDGRAYSLKHHQLRRFRALPRLASHRFELALAIHDGDRHEVEEFASEDWAVVDAGVVAGDPWLFADYVRASDAEWSVAQGVYAETNSGWLSDRTASYLASGRPAVVQETGQSRSLPTGKGLCTFATLPDAVEAVRGVARDWQAHASAARDLATAHFDSDVVLARFLEQCGVAP